MSASITRFMSKTAFLWVGGGAPGHCIIGYHSRPQVFFFFFLTHVYGFWWDIRRASLLGAEVSRSGGFPAFLSVFLSVLQSRLSDGSPLATARVESFSSSMFLSVLPHMTCWVKLHSSFFFYLLSASSGGGFRHGTDGLVGEEDMAAQNTELRDTAEPNCPGR